MPKGFMLTAEAVQKIKNDHESLRLRVRELEGKAARSQSQVAIENIIWVKVQEVIEPKTTVRFGHGKAIVQRVEFTKDEDRASADYGKILTSSFTDQTRRLTYGGEDEEREIDVYNDSLVAIPDQSYVRCFRNVHSGLFMIETPQTVIGYSEDGIGARSGDEPATGSIRLVYKKDDNTLADIEKEIEGDDPKTYNLSVWNVADATVASNTYVMAKRNALSGNWFVDFAEC